MESDQENKVSSEEDEDDFEQSQSTDIYNLFKTAHSILSRPSFGNQVAASRGPKFLQKIVKPNKQGDKNKKKNNEESNSSLNQSAVF